MLHSTVAERPEKPRPVFPLFPTATAGGVRKSAVGLITLASGSMIQKASVPPSCGVSRKTIC